MSEMFQELLSSSPYAIIELFELHLDLALHGSSDIVRFHAGVNEKSTAGDVIWQGYTYQALPIEVEGFEYNGSGQLPRPKARVANLMGGVSALLLGVNEITPGNDLIGAKFIRIRTLSRFLDPVNFTGGVNPYGTPADEEMPREVYYIDRKSAENRNIVEFELAAVFDLAGVRAPKRQVLANLCQWKYRSAECGYTGGNFYDELDQPLGATPATNFGASAFGNQLTSPSTLGEGDALVSPNGWYRALLQSDGNFVVSNKAGLVVWSTNTPYGDGAYELQMRTGGNVVLVNGSNVIWQTNTWGSAPATVSFIAMYPPDAFTGKMGGFGYQIVGFSPTGLGQQQTVTSTFTIATGKTITLQMVFNSLETIQPHYTGLAYAWTTVSYTVTASTGFWFLNEVFNATVQLTVDNPFRANHPTLGTLTEAGPQLQVTSTTNNSGNKFTLANDGSLTVYNVNNLVLYSSGYSNASEPLVQTGTVDPLRDVCGKRISSCRLRFPAPSDVPFGSFPAAGTFYG
jgi:lambda family phage minor tail protein L